METISIVVPCLNEQEAIPLFYDAFLRETAAMDVAFEFWFIDDGSTDGTMDALRALRKADERVHFISFSRNFGKESAMYAGMQAATGAYVAIMDVDLQDPPSLLPDMLHGIRNEGYDCVATRRVTRKGEPKVRSFFARAFYRLINRISKTQIVDGARDFRLMKREMVDAIVSMCEYNRFSKGIFGWIGFKTKWLPYKNVERVAGETKWSFFKLFKYSLDGIVNFSQAPLSIASVSGLILTAIAFFMILFVVIRRLIFGDPVAGWASTVCIILFIGGVQLLCMGIMGQYLAKTYLEVKNRPHFIISETNDKDAKRIG